MGKEVYFLSGLTLLVIAYVAYISCTTQWPFEPLNYCNNFTPFFGSCDENIEMLGNVMFVLMIFGIILTVYAVLSFLSPVVKKVTEEKHVRTETFVGVAMPENKKIPTEIISKTQDGIVFLFVLQRIDTTQALANKQLKITIHNNILNVLTNKEGEFILDLRNYISTGEKRNFYVEFLGDEYFKYSKYELKDESN
ncbi:hypothetical protein KO465_06505 [Candidatus Micrarchaeota archaeon]|jgi:hypothetical protein|nr:hypothetical protein [Candidatus Micrarchaeota archaeon]